MMMKKFLSTVNIDYQESKRYSNVHKDFYKVFVKSDSELEKENIELKKAFQLLTQGIYNDI
jgi:hypothetical protein